jgi:hypothetical protein
MKKHNKSFLMLGILITIFSLFGCSEAKIPEELKIAVTSIPLANSKVITQIVTNLNPGQRLNVHNMDNKLLAVFTARTDNPVTITFNKTARYIVVKERNRTQYFALPITWKIETLPN